MKKFINIFTKEEFIGIETDRYIKYNITKYGIECFTIEDLETPIVDKPETQVSTETVNKTKVVKYTRQPKNKKV